MDAVPGETQSLAGERIDGLLVIRSLTKHWSIPGIRAGYVTGDPAVVAALAAAQPPWSVSAPAIAAMIACTGRDAAAEGRERALSIGRWRDYLEAGLGDRRVEHVPSSAPFVLARLGDGTRATLRGHGVAVRRGDTFPGLDATWARIAVRPPPLTDRLLSALDQVRR
jgi:cobyrinic acid a,c-diamide synthase